MIDIKTKKQVKEILASFEKLYPDAKCELYYNTPFQLLIATILSAQATDKKVNEITKVLFEEYETSYDFVKLSQEELEKKVNQINLYKNKSKNILKTCQMLIDNYSGEVPKTREQLEELAGVGRKTANVVMSNCFGMQAIAVDTHVFRVSNRLGLVNTKEPLKTELDLQKIIPEDYWSKSHNYFVLHGRYVCNAKKPKCDECHIIKYCDFFNKDIDK